MYSYYLSVKVFDAASLEPFCEIERANVIDFWLSPQGSYVATWERPGKYKYAILIPPSNFFV